MIAEALSIVTDPGHLLAEGMFRIAELVLEVAVIRHLVRRHDQKRHGVSW